MSDNFTTLDRPDKLDTKSWNINFSQLTTPKRGVYPYHNFRDGLQESTDKRFACLFYTINEYRMGWEAGLVGIFANKSNPTLLANPKNQWFDYQGARSLVFSGNHLFLRKLAFNQNDKLSGTPFVIFDLTKGNFAFIDFDVTSAYYSPVRISDTVYKFNLDTPEEIKHIKLPNRDGQIFDITTLKYYSFNQLDNLVELYFEEKRNSC